MASRPKATVWEPTNPKSFHQKHWIIKLRATTKTSFVTTTPAEYAQIHVHASCMTCVKSKLTVSVLE